jgi:hypothetical protein
LSELYLKDNQLVTGGAGRLTEVLKQCPTLSILGLTGNQIGDQGAGSLSDQRSRNGDTSRSAEAVPIDVLPGSWRQSDRRSRSRETRRSAASVPSTVYPAS